LKYVILVDREEETFKIPRKYKKGGNQV